MELPLVTITSSSHICCHITSHNSGANGNIDHGITIYHLFNDNRFDSYHTYSNQLNEIPSSIIL